jgi:hypothetical protein
MKAALIQHMGIAVYQAVYCWGQKFITTPTLPSPDEWGWRQVDKIWEPRWTNLPEATDACRELLRCGCQKACTGRCKCLKAALACTALCQCGGQCGQYWNDGKTHLHTTLCQSTERTLHWLLKPLFHGLGIVYSWYIAYCIILAFWY